VLGVLQLLHRGCMTADGLTFDAMVQARTRLQASVSREVRYLGHTRSIKVLTTRVWVSGSFFWVWEKRGWGFGGWAEDLGSGSLGL
jgi:hypothetical protein